MTKRPHINDKTKRHMKIDFASSSSSSLRRHSIQLTNKPKFSEKYKYRSARNGSRFGKSGFADLRIPYCLFDDDDDYDDEAFFDYHASSYHIFYDDDNNNSNHNNNNDDDYNNDYNDEEQYILSEQVVANSVEWRSTESNFCKAPSDGDLGFYSEYEPLGKTHSPPPPSTYTSQSIKPQCDLPIPRPAPSGKHINVYICGPHSAGKSTLIRDVQMKHPDFVVREEIARIYMAEKKITAEDFNPEKYPDEFERVEKDLLMLQVFRDMQDDDDEMEDGVYLNDRGLDALIYILHYHKDGQRIVDDIIKNNNAVKMCIEKAKRRSSLTLIVKPHVELLEDDEVRMVSPLDDLMTFYDKMVTFYRDVLEIPFGIIGCLDRHERVELVSERILEILEDDD